MTDDETRAWIEKEMHTAGGQRAIALMRMYVALDDKAFEEEK